MKLLFLPIDIDLTGFDFKQYDRSLENNQFNPYWDSTFISRDTIDKNNFDKILNQLPFTKITRLMFKTQKIAVGPHVDVMEKMILEDGEYDHISNNEPCGYRIVITGDRDKLNLKINDKFVTARLPSVPCCYVLNSTEALHSVDFDSYRETIYVRGFVDEIKNQTLLKKSLEKYKEFAIYG
jgi:hypothetical protein